ncbi:hypothetical protein L6452_26089 [Arctium lappa]|uniref:Uncharacterized protein n=1 Tax=Arctium lappa TaxID=4217 RepID=A0ACB9ACE2_ARCLA|nr:hypothetical protein L6452_26089 [Arctium lappa]
MARAKRLVSTPQPPSTRRSRRLRQENAATTVASTAGESPTQPPVLPSTASITAVSSTAVDNTTEGDKDDFPFAYPKPQSPITNENVELKEPPPTHSSEDITEEDDVVVPTVDRVDMIDVDLNYMPSLVDSSTESGGPLSNKRPRRVFKKDGRVNG